EFTIFMGAIKALPVQTVLGIAGIIFTAVYILRTIANVLFGPRRSEWDHLTDIRGPELVPLVLFGFVIFVGGIFPNILLGMIDTGVTSSGLAKVLEMVSQAKMGGLF
ncbi:NADH-quinone oxidoreductase subunit M, partial [Desulfosporosinus sp. SRJS8]|nr:NADH-quinone oxidoreductase subunit M [Desulfosporosinus sp. SRJS8]